MTIAIILASQLERSISVEVAKIGMSYEDVVKIIGFEGTETSVSESDGVKTVTYTWQNEDGSKLNGMFQNNKLSSKEQFDLK